MGKLGSSIMLGHAFILGETGQVGRAVASNLLEHGWNVTLLHRGRQIVPARLQRAGEGVDVCQNRPGRLLVPFPESGLDSRKQSFDREE
jgi:nucleoside-diphosphate-sugar epimerase